MNYQDELEQACRGYAKAKDDVPRPPAHTRVAIDGGPIQGDDDGPSGEGSG